MMLPSAAWRRSGIVAQIRAAWPESEDHSARGFRFLSQRVDGRRTPRISCPALVVTTTVLTPPPPPRPTGLGLLFGLRIFSRSASACVLPALERSGPTLVPRAST